MADATLIRFSERPNTSMLLSPWKLAATTIEAQLSLKQAREHPAFGTHNQGTRADCFVTKFMHCHMSTKEVDFAAEMAPGVGPTIACQGISSVALQVTLSLFWHGS
jgi:hypothetical protein